MSDLPMVAEAEIGAGVNTPCREWRGAIAKNGYGVRGVPGERRTVRVHRWVVASIHGWEAIEGLDVMHLCDNRRCYRYDHLRLGTRRQNLDDARAKGRMKSPPVNNNKGERCGASKLTEAIVAEMREAFASGRTQRSLADEFGVNQSAVSRIVSRKTWKVVE